VSDSVRWPKLRCRGMYGPAGMPSTFTDRYIKISLWLNFLWQGELLHTMEYPHKASESICDHYLGISNIELSWGFTIACFLQRKHHQHDPPPTSSLQDPCLSNREEIAMINSHIISQVMMYKKRWGAHTDMTSTIILQKATIANVPTKSSAWVVTPSPGKVSRACRNNRATSHSSVPSLN
jgi:hypothetical protein